MLYKPLPIGVDDFEDARDADGTKNDNSNLFTGLNIGKDCQILYEE